MPLKAPSAPTFLLQSWYAPGEKHNRKEGKESGWRIGGSVEIQSVSDEIFSSGSGARANLVGHAPLTTGSATSPCGAGRMRKLPFFRTPCVMTGFSTYFALVTDNSEWR